MMSFKFLITAGFLCFLACATCGCDPRLKSHSIIMPEQRLLGIRDLKELPQARLPDVPPPPTVLDQQKTNPERRLSLDEAIRIALDNSEAVRFLTGSTAVFSGLTIYDPAISNTAIDEEQGRFDPTLELNNSWDRSEPPQAIFDPDDSTGARITGITTDAHNSTARLSKTNVLGGVASLAADSNFSRSRPGIFPLKPRDQDFLTMSYVQPLLQGAGVRANLAPIVIARINTERSYFQLKDGLQELVRGVIEGYWALVFARTDVWAREQQVSQGKVALNFADAQKRAGRGNAGDVAQAKLALANFRANLVAAKANELQREAALRNILGLPPSDGQRLVPITPPFANQVQIKWEELLRLAEQRRPDLIELKLIIEADRQLLAVANNNARPSVDAVGLYRWNGLEGDTPARVRISTGPGQFTDWTLGVNIALPLGLRRDRATLRRQELIIARDFAALNQGLHAATHDLATSTRNLAQFFEQFRQLKEARNAAFVNLRVQQLTFKNPFGDRQPIQLNVLQAIADWGNAISAEAQSLAQYNTELATLERLSGTILETHGVHLFEERFGAIGPLGRHAKPREYPRATVPGPNVDRYPVLDEPAENFFDLKDPQKSTGEDPEKKESKSSTTGSPLPVSLVPGSHRGLPNPVRNPSAHGPILSVRSTAAFASQPIEQSPPKVKLGYPGPTMHRR